MKRKIDLNALRTLCLVVDTGGFSAAAHASQRAVSSVSRQIAALEHALGQTLFYRHTRAISLTEAGARYVAAIRPLLDGLDEAAERLALDEARPSGLLVVNAPVAFGERQVVPLVQAFRARYPDVRAELRLADAFVDPVRAGSDVTFRVGALDDSSFIAHSLAPMRYVLAAAPVYIARQGAPESPAELLDHACLRYQGEYGRQRWFWRRDRADAFAALDVDGPLYSNDAASLRAAALLGEGLVLFPSWLIDRELAAGTLVALLEHYEWEVAGESREIYLLHGAGRQPPAKIAAFVEFVRDAIGRPAAWDRRAGLDVD